jgi:RNA polymerase sigma-70 factor (family 1)
LPDNSAHNEKELLLRIVEGDEQAFATIFNHYKDRIFYFALSVTKSDFLAEEITQNTFLKVWQQRMQLNSIDYFPSWIKAIARNDTFNYLKRLATEHLVVQQLSLNTTDQDTSTEQSLVWKEYQAIVASAINGLPNQQRKIFVLARNADKSYSEIASELGISINTVKFHMKQALLFIRNHVDSHTVVISIYFFCNSPTLLTFPIV